MKYRIEQIAGFTTKKDGTPYLDKYGKPAKNVVMTINGERVSFFDTHGTSRNWVAGMEIEGEITENNGYKNFRPAFTKRTDPMLVEILNKVNIILLKLGGGESKLLNQLIEEDKKKNEVVEVKTEGSKEQEEINVDDLPF